MRAFGAWRYRAPFRYGPHALRAIVRIAAACSRTGYALRIGIADRRTQACFASFRAAPIIRRHVRASPGAGRTGAVV